MIESKMIPQDIREIIHFYARYTKLGSAPNVKSNMAGKPKINPI